MSLSTDTILAAVAIIFSITGWLLRQKDAKQAEEILDLKTSIITLFNKHDADVRALQELRIHIAEGHYKKAELDVKFDKIETTFKNGFIDLGGKFDKLYDALLKHMLQEENR